MKRFYGYFGLLLCIALITFFGLGLAVFADVSTKEKISILAVVLILYVIIAALYEYFRGNNNKDKEEV